MRAKHVVLALSFIASLSSGCLRLMDRPEEVGAEGTECYSSSDCKDGAPCLMGDGYSGVCGEVGDCESNFQCGEGEACQSGKCRAVECTSSADDACGAYGCNTETFVCRRSCTGDFECQGDNVCRSGTCQSSKCTAENAAVICMGYTCDTVLGECRDSTDYSHECSEVGCASGYVCKNNYYCKKSCSPSSTDTRQCGNYKCLPDNSFYDSPGTCPELCSDHSDCLNGTVCINSKCAKQ